MQPLGLITLKPRIKKIPLQSDCIFAIIRHTHLLPISLNLSAARPSSKICRFHGDEDREVYGSIPILVN